jgi:hypothetical protein
MQKSWLPVMLYASLSVITICISGCSETPTTYDAELRRANGDPTGEKAKKREADFKAMTPAQHLEAAKAYKLEKETPINADLWIQLDAIPKDAPEFKEAEVLRKRAADILADFAEKNDLKNNPLKIVESHWSAGGFGTVGIWKVTFKNRSDKPIGNIRYKTTYDAETGNKVSSGSGLIQKVIPPNSQRTLEINDGFISKEAYKAGFEITKWEFVKDAR